MPLWCDVCGSYRIDEVASPSGLVTEVTTVRHMPGRFLSPQRLGTVRLDGGAVVVARLEAAVGEGRRVDVVVDDGAPVARPRTSAHDVPPVTASPAPSLVPTQEVGGVESA